MATSGTYSFAPSAGEVVLNALSRIQIRGPAVSSEHMMQAGLEANFLQIEWNNRGPNLWTVDDQLITCVTNQATYTVPPETVMILDVTIGTSPLGTTTIGTQTGLPQNEISITPLSRSEYMSYPNKGNPGRPTSYWFDRLVAPTITLWPVPDGSATYYLHYYRFRQIQDASMANGLNLEMQTLWMDAAAAGMAYRLARHYAPALEPMRKMDYKEAYEIAATQNTENGVALYLIPMIGGYYR